MIAEILIFILSTIVIYAVVNHKRQKDFFRSRDVKFVPGVPLFGNTFKSTFLKRHIIEDIDELYRTFPEERYMGLIEGLVPVFMIRDPELIKQITVKDFDHFTDHRVFFTDELFNNSLLMMKGDKWRDMRTTLSPAFTGSKMKLMVPFMTEISNNIVQHLRETQNEVIDINDLIRRYTNDVIASTAFGLQVNSLQEKDNKFFKLGQTIIQFTPMTRFKIFLTATFPAIGKYMNIFPASTTDFFRDTVKNTMEYREKNNIVRPDMIQLLMEASKGTLRANTNQEKDSIGFATVDEVNTKTDGQVRRWTPDELAGQAFIFFFAGYESTATALVMAIHELALNPDIQDKLFNEVKKYSENHKQLTYETIPELKYLDGVLNETMRKYAAALILDRVCKKPYTLPPPREGGKPCPIEAGQVVYNLVNPLHLDEKYYPNPNKFDPDRFSDENKHTIDPFTFLPFGAGPRNCIGSRFALLELKVLLYSIILEFKIVKCEKTSDPIKLSPLDFQIKAIGGTFVQFQARSKTLG